MRQRIRNIINAFKPKMPFKEAWKMAEADWQEALEFDARGIVLGRWILFFLLLGSVLIDIWLGKSTSFSWWLLLPAAILLTIPPLRISPLSSGFDYHLKFIRSLHSSFDENIAVAFALILAGALAGVFAGVFAGAEALAFALALAGAVAGDFVGAVAFALALAAALAGALALAVAGAGALAFAFALILAGALAFAVDNVYEHLSNRSKIYFDRSRNYREIWTRGKKPEIFHESADRNIRIQQIIELLAVTGKVSAGLAGRRGLGKTNLLNRISDLFQENSHSETLTENQLKDDTLIRSNRIKRLTLFIHTPTEFGEMNFLMALLEQFCQRVGQALTGLIPAIKPHIEERELVEKRRLLRGAHAILLLQALLALILFGFIYQQSAVPDPLLRSVGLQDSSSVAGAQSSGKSKLFRQMRDSLNSVMHGKLELLNDSLSTIEQLLDPDFNLRNKWNLKKNRPIWEEDLFKISATLDSLLRLKKWPGETSLDSARLFLLSAKSILGSIKTQEDRLKALKDSLNYYENALFQQPGISGVGWNFKNSAFYIWLLAFIAAVAHSWRSTREGVDRLVHPLYEPLKNEIALYRRTSDLLERLQYQMSFGESQEQSANAGMRKYSLFEIKRSFSKTRSQRPFTILSLVQEYRQYIDEVIFYLNKAREEDLKYGETLQEEVKILICIDELDKVLNSERLYEMLKSIKAIFDIPNVYYLLSISEDALETYRLRSIETKNEIDSAFTHIFNIPPMDAESILIFHLQRQPAWPVEILPAAIVLGGGVPRDMHRLSQLLAINTECQEGLQSCLGVLQSEDRAALRAILEQHPLLADEWTFRLTELFSTAEFKTVAAVDEFLKQVAALNSSDFKTQNTAAEPAAGQALQQIKTLLRAMAVKSYIYHLLATEARLQIPATLSAWPKPDDLEAYIENLSRKRSIQTWLGHLQPLQNAIFDLSANPLKVYKNLKEIYDL